MATTEESVQYALYADGLKVPAKAWHGRQYVAYGEYEAAALTTGSTVQMVRLPAGAKVLDGKLWFDGDGGSGSGTFSVGDASDVDRLMLATVTRQGPTYSNTCGRFHVIGAVAGAHTTGCGFEYGCDITISVTTGGTGSYTGTIKLVLTYSLV